MSHLLYLSETRSSIWKSSPKRTVKLESKKLLTEKNGKILYLLTKKGEKESPRNFCRDLYNRMKFRDLYIKQYALFKRMRFLIVVAGLPKSKNELEDDINYDLPKSTDIHP